MKKALILAAFAAVTGASVVTAQGGPPGGRGRGPEGRGGPGAMLDRGLLKGITLTDAQKEKLEDIRKAEREAMEAQSPDARQAEMKAIRDARQSGDTVTFNRLVAEQRARMDARRDKQIAAIRAILTGDQLATFDANVAEVKQRQADGPGFGGRGGPGGRGRGQRPPGA